MSELPKEFPRKPMEGKPIPDVSLPAYFDGKMQPLNTKTFFANKTVVVLSVPGAFTATCSNSHLPRYEQLAALFKNNGVEEILCFAVNDPFVIETWGKQQKLKTVKLVSDGNCEFTKGMGMEADFGKGNMGFRSWRYSMLVQNGIIKKIFPEQVQPNTSLELSTAEHMLEYLDEKVKIPPGVLMFTKPGCSFCAKARKLLNEKGYSFEEVVIGAEGTVSTAALFTVSGRTTTPQIFIDGKHIGGADDLEKYFA